MGGTPRPRPAWTALLGMERLFNGGGGPIGTNPAEGRRGGSVEDDDCGGGSGASGSSYLGRQKLW